MDYTFLLFSPVFRFCYLLYYLRSSCHEPQTADGIVVLPGNYYKALLQTIM